MKLSSLQVAILLRYKAEVEKDKQEEEFDKLKLVIHAINPDMAKKIFAKKIVTVNENVLAQIKKDTGITISPGLHESITQSLPDSTIVMTDEDVKTEDEFLVKEEKGEL